MIEDRVCVVTHPLNQAGENATRSLLEIIAAITTVHLVTADLPTDSAIRSHYEVTEVTKKGAGQRSVLVGAIRFVRNQIRMLRAIAGRDEEIILFFGATAYLLPMIGTKLLGRTVVSQPRGDIPLTLRLEWESRLPSPLARLLAGVVLVLERIGYRLSDAIIVYTPAMAEQIGLDPSDEKVYTSGARYVDTELFSPEGSFQNREKRVGYLGRLDPEKGVRELTETASMLSDDVTFRFIGDGSLRGWVEHRLSKAISENRVELTGWVNHDEVPGELNRLRLLVVPSRPTEGLPTAILESLACGTPVYAMPVSGVPDVVEDGVTGFLMDSYEPEKMAAGIERILDYESIDTVSTRGRALIESEYTFDAAVDRYRSILERVSAP